MIFTIAGLFLLHYSALVNTFSSYKSLYGSLYYARNITECTPLDYGNLDINITEMKAQLEQLEGVRCYSRAGALSALKYKNVSLDFVMIEEDFWNGFSELADGTGYSETGLSADGRLQAVLVDPYGLIRGNSAEVSFNDKLINVDITARFSAPYMMPNLSHYGDSELLSLFNSGKTCLIFKKCGETADAFSENGVLITEQFTRFFFVEYDAADQLTDQKVKSLLNENDYMYRNLKNDSLMEMSSLQGGAEDTIAACFYLLFVFLLFCFSFLIVLYKANADEFSLLRLVGMRESDVRKMSFLVSLSPFLLSLAADLVMYVLFSATGKAPVSFLSLEKPLIFSFPLYLLFLCFLAAFFLLLSGLVLITMYRKQSVVVSVKELNV